LLLAAQVTGAGLVFVAWAFYSRIVPLSSATIGIEAFALGTILYLPVSLGLPFIAANLFRRDPPDQNIGSAGALVMLVLTSSAVVAAIGMVSSIFAICSHTSSSIGMGFLLGSAGSVGVMLQQLARIRMSVWKMLFASSVNVTLPCAFSLTVLLNLSAAASQVIVLGIVAFYGLGVGAVCCRVIRPRLVLRKSATKRLLVSAIPLVPHLLAFSFLMQGLRVQAVLSGASSEVLAASHYLMVVLNAGLVVISSIHGLLSVRVQTASQKEFWSMVQSNAGSYATLAVLSSIVTVASLRSPLVRVFEGLPIPSYVVLAGLCVGIAALCSYYFLSSICIREGEALLLATVSTSTAILVVVAQTILGFESLNSLVALYAISLAVLPVLLSILMFVLMRRVKWVLRAGIKALPFALAPAAVMILLHWGV
jgi:hypothetical protein